MLGHIMEWFYEGLAGISQAEGSVAYKTIAIRPQVIGDITSAKANYTSAYGYIESAWKKDKNYFQLDVKIPANTTAILYLPATKKSLIKQDGILRKVNVGDNHVAIIKIGSGNYHFEVN